MRTLPGLLLLLAACTAPSKGDGETAETGTNDTADTDTADTGDTDTADTGSVVVPRIAFFDDVGAVDLTPDGATALVQRLSSLEGEVLFIDTVTDAVTSVTTLGDATKNMATGLSADGRISALRGIPVEASVWTGAAWQDLPSPYTSGCDPDNGGAFDVSDDGTVAVGLMWDGCTPAAFRWTESGGVEPLAIIGEAYEGSSNPPTNRASVVSGDGKVAAGFATYNPLDRSPALWAEDGTGSLLAPDDRDMPGEVLSIDYDGSTLGVSRGYDGYVWTAEGGFVSLGRLPAYLPTDDVYPNALSADGTAVFGGVGSEFWTVPSAFVWTEADGMRSLQEVAVAAGLTIEEGYWLTTVMAVSDDGTVLLGRAFDADFATKTFVMHMPAATWGI